MTGNLESMRQRLESQLREAAPSRELLDSIRIHQAADPIDMTQQAAEREMAVKNLDRDSALVRRLRSAIERINHGSYGVCLQCEENIAPKRLNAIPWAELCIKCQERADRRGGETEIAPTMNDRAEAA
jgi:DnaK suppressor protein